MVRKFVLAVVILAVGAPAFARELTSAYVITAVANKAGVAPTDWHSDLTLYNPQSRALSVNIFFLPSGQDNSNGAPELPLVTLAPWQTLNLWDILGPYGFNARGWTGALLVYADAAASGCPNTTGDTSCDFAGLIHEPFAAVRQHNLERRGVAPRFARGDRFPNLFQLRGNKSS